MGRRNSDEWLPEGWRVQLKARKDGKKYKCYFAPSDGLKFYSKPEVSRYLSKIGQNKSEENDKDTSERHNKSEEKYEVSSKNPDESEEKDKSPSMNHNESSDKDKGPSKICNELEEKDKGTSQHHNKSGVKDSELHNESEVIDKGPSKNLNESDTKDRGSSKICNESEDKDKGPSQHHNESEVKDSELNNLSKETNEGPSKNLNDSDEKNRSPRKICNESEEKDKGPSQHYNESKVKDSELHNVSKDTDEAPSKHQNESEEMDKKPKKQSRKHVVFEKVSAEGLPSGWTKVIRVTTKGCNKVRRDALYIDPVTQYVFHSLKDMLRYVDTGDLGRLATKPKDKTGRDYVNLDNDKICSPSVAKKQKLDVNETSPQSKISWSSESHEMIKDEPVLLLNDTVSIGECKSSSECPSDKCGVSAELGNSNLAEVEGSSKHVEEDKKMEERGSVMNPEDKKSSVSDVVVKYEWQRRNTKKTKELSTPRRASKRLAGVQLDPTPGLETIYQTRRGAVKQSGEPDMKSIVEIYKITEDLPKSSKDNHPAPSVEKVKTENVSDEKQENSVVLSTSNISTMGCEGNVVETNNEVNEKPKPLPDVPLVDLWTDPCIAFAIKTLTGVSFDSSETMELTKSCGSPSGSMPVVEATSKKENVGPTSDKSPVTCDEHGKGSGSNGRTGECGTDMPFMDIWRDPCIEFAIKTLTGTIPVGVEPDNRDYYQQQEINLSQAQASSGSNLPDFGLDNFCQTEYLCQQFDTAPIEQTLQPTSKRASLQNSSAATNLDQQRSDWKWRYRG